MRRVVIRGLRRWLFIGHRWIGIVSCLLFAMWFGSGLVMMYVAFPRLTDQERLAALPDIAWNLVGIAPDQAMAAAGLAQYPRDLRLNMLADEPVFRLLEWDGRRRTISARNGRMIDQITLEQALAVARLHPSAANAQLIGMVDRDQWTVTARFDPFRPMFLVALGDPEGTELYVSARSGEIVLDTTRHERVWNWFGSIPHWIYPTVLRKDGGLWRQVVLWTSGVCMAVAASGIWIGLLRIRLRRRYAGGGVTPYRGWMAWHHVTGCLAGMFVLTWIFSGWLSLDPGAVFAGRDASREMALRYAGHDSPSVAAQLPPAPEASAVEARLVWLGGHPLMVLADRSGEQVVTDPTTGAAASLSEARIFTAARQLMPQAAMTMGLRLEQHDAYWYSHHEQRRLPVLRIGFDDRAQTWFHVDPRTGEILGRIDGSRRSYRWLFNALHSFDFPLLMAHRPAWNAVVSLLSLLGMVISVSGVAIGWRRLCRGIGSGN